MNTLTQFDDRRKHRSNQTNRAIELQLEHLLDQYQFHTMVVCDRDGLRLSSVGDDVDHQCVAAFTPYIGEAVGQDREGFASDLLDELGDFEDPTHVAVRSFPAQGAKLYVCAISPRRDGVDVALDHAVAGIRRIFETTKAA